MPVDTLEYEDYLIGIGRLGDRTDRLRPFTRQRLFGFSDSSIYGATQAGHGQIERIDKYIDKNKIPVYYGLYNPLTLPFKGLYPAAPGNNAEIVNEFGFRVLSSTVVHGALGGLEKGQAPSVADLTLNQALDASDPLSTRGWRLERFVADEVLRCRHGRLFDDDNDPNLAALFYSRSAPITAAIVLTIDIAGDRRD